MSSRGLTVLAAAVLVCVFAGCASIHEVGKTLWGSSIRELQKHRTDAITKTYNKGFWDCVQASLAVIDKNKYTVFQKDEVNGYIVIMGIPGYVNTTEVGIFFVELAENQTRIELSSLSTNAKRAAAKALFKGLDEPLNTTP